MQWIFSVCTKMKRKPNPEHSVGMVDFFVVPDIKYWFLGRHVNNQKYMLTFNVECTPSSFHHSESVGHLAKLDSLALASLSYLFQKRFSKCLKWICPQTYIEGVNFWCWMDEGFIGMQHFPISPMKAITISLASTVQQFDFEQLKVNDAKIVILSVGYR